MNNLENRIPPPLVAIAFALAMAAMAGLVGELTFVFPGQRGLAAGILLAGLAIIAMAVIQFRRARTTVNPLRPEEASALVTGGIFDRTRNPMYLGMAVILLAWMVYLGSLPALLGIWGFKAWIDRFQIAPEERALKAHFGAEFEGYAAKVRRWV